MDENKLHPTVEEFKAFLNNHPKLVEDVRKGGRSWQEHYEKWVLLGEDDPLWEQYKEGNEKEIKGQTKEKQSELFGQLLKLTENVDLNKVQKQVHQLTNTITTIQEVLGQFQGTNKSTPPHRDKNQPFNWFRD